MPPQRHVDSPRNPLVKEAVRLRQRRARDATGLFLVEGAREALRALRAGVQVERVLLCPELDRAGGAAALAEAAHAAGVEVVTLARGAFERASQRQGPDGALVIARRPAWGLETLRLPRRPLLLVLDALEKPGNLGALLRTADAVGVDAVLVSGDGTDLGNPNVVRASMGSLFALAVAAAPAEDLRAALRAWGVRLVATAPAATTDHWDVSYEGSVAIVMGAEHRGLDDGWLSAAQDRVRIPMHPRAADSLNVAVAGSVVLYEALRQRSTRG